MLVRRPMELVPFARQARRACPGHAELALALVIEFRPQLAGVDAALDRLADGLLGCADEPPGEQLARCAEAVAARLHCATLSWSGIDDLLLDPRRRRPVRPPSRAGRRVRRGRAAGG